MKIAAHILYFDCEDKILAAIENCAPFVDKIYISYSKYPWSYNLEAQEKYLNTSSLKALEKSKYKNKLEVIEGKWNLEENQRNECAKKAKAEGFDYLIVHDADEFYFFEDYKGNIEEIKKNPDFDLYRVPWISFWKNAKYVIENKKGEIVAGYPEFAINLNRNVKFSRARTTNAKTVYKLPGLCFHLSYVSTNYFVFRKIKTWGHSHQFDTDKWYAEKWLSWQPNSKNLHPIKPSAWKKAKEYIGPLPEIIIKFKFHKYLVTEE